MLSEKQINEFQTKNQRVLVLMQYCKFIVIYTTFCCALLVRVQVAVESLCAPKAIFIMQNRHKLRFDHEKCSKRYHVCKLCTFFDTFFLDVFKTLTRVHNFARPKIACLIERKQIVVFLERGSKFANLQPKRTHPY